jgi:hypothetical protein
MKYLILTIGILFLGFQSVAQENITSLLPDPFGLPGLQPKGEAEIYKGDYLFDLINGGADVYFEYGFEQVITQNYQGVDGKSGAKVEIYQMTDTDAAYGILSLTASTNKITESRGSFSVTGKGYKMIQKGNYFVILSYANLQDELKDDVVDRMSEEIESNIKELANYPSVVTAVKEPCPGVKRALYFKGEIALRNATYIDFKIPFSYKDGMFYRCDVYDYIVFIPEGNVSRKEITESLISNIINTNPDFSPHKETFGFSIKASDQLKYEILPDGDRIVLIKYQ